MARSRAIKVLDNALSGSSGAKNCEIFVEALGLKPLFATFMGKVPLLATLKRAFLGLFFGVKTACFGRLHSGLATFYDALFPDPYDCTVLGSIMRRSAFTR